MGGRCSSRRELGHQVNITNQVKLKALVSRRVPSLRQIIQAETSFCANTVIFIVLLIIPITLPALPHVTQAKICLRVCQVVFLGILPFSPHLLIGPSHMS